MSNPNVGPVRRLLKHVGIVASAGILGSALAFLGSIAAARYLGPAALGSIVLLQAIIFSVDRLVNFQSWRMVIKYGADAREEGPAAFAEILKFGTLLDVVSAAVGALLAIGATFVAAETLDWSTGMHRMALVYAAIISLNLTGTPTAVLRMFDRYRVFVVQRVVAGLIKLIGVGVAWAVSGGAVWVLGGWILGELVGWFIVMFAGWAELRRRKLGGFMRADVRQIGRRHPGVWRFAILTNLSLAIRMASKELDDIVVGILLSEHALGLYRVAKQFAVILGTVHDALAQPLYPDLSRYAAERQWRKFSAAFFGGMRIAATVVVPGWLGLVLLGRWLIRITSGPEFVDAHGVLIFYAAGVSVASIFHGLSSLPMALNRPKVPLYAMLVATFVQFGMLFALVPTLDLVAAGVGVTGYYVTWALVSAWFVRDVPARLRNQP